MHAVPVEEKPQIPRVRSVTHDMIDLHAKRVQADLRTWIPGAIWLGPFAVAALSLAAIGYHAGMVGSRRSLIILAVAFTFSVVIELSADLDRPQEGVLGGLSTPLLTCNDQ
jgi:hypothetical protein